MLGRKIITTFYIKMKSFYSGYHTLTLEKMYFENSPYTGINLVDRAMPQNRYFDIKTNIYIVTNCIYLDSCYKVKSITWFTEWSSASVLWIFWTSKYWWKNSSLLRKKWLQYASEMKTSQIWIQDEATVFIRWLSISYNSIWG